MGLEGFALAGAVLGAILGLLLLVALTLLLLRWWMRGSRVTSEARLDGKTVVITGANTGIGAATAMELSRRGANIVMLCRDTHKAEDAKEEVKKETRGAVEVFQLDLASLDSVRRCVDQLNNTLLKIDVLVNNAGLVCNEARTEDGFEMQFGVNHLGHFLLTNLLLPLVKKAAPGARVINVSSLAHKFGHIHWDDVMFEKTEYDPFKAYAQSKLANVLFTKELARKGEGSGVNFYAVHPGTVATDIGRYTEDNYGCCVKRIMDMAKNLMKSPELGAQTSVYCAVEESLADCSGGYYSDCKEARPSATAESLEDAHRLWLLSAQLTRMEDV